mmetsp:Transcript_25909/g.29914  ORF Transcript_25909/g.29914 Transcript_25909/m.29914 type:complete len:86 (-) Transcript_25909:142-399(-)
MKRTEEKIQGESTAKRVQMEEQKEFDEKTQMVIQDFRLAQAIELEEKKGEELRQMKIKNFMTPQKVIDKVNNIQSIQKFEIMNLE